MSWSKVSHAIDQVLDLKKSAEKLVFLKRPLIWLMTTFAVGMVIVHVAVRFFIWPQLESKKTEYEQLASKALGVTVSFAELKANWNVFWPAFELKNVSFSNPQTGSQLLSIPQITGSLAWESLWHLKPYFHNLSFSNATIQVIRDAKGNWVIAGIPIQSGQGTFANWLLDQDHIDLVNTRVDWLDQQKQSSKHVLTFNSLTLNNSWMTHAVKTQFQSPWHQDVANLEGRFKHGFLRSASDWGHWSGQFAWEFAGLDLQVASELDIPKIKIASGTINTKGRAYLDDGIIDSGKGQLSGRQIRVDWDGMNQPLKIESINAELEENTSGNIMTLSTPSLSWATNQAPPQELKDFSFYWKIAPSVSEIKHAGIKVDQIEISFIEQLAQQIPLPREVGKWIRDYRAQGTLKNLDANWNDSAKKLPFDIRIPGIEQSRYKLAFEFERVFLSPDKNSGIAAQNLSGKLVATELGGHVFAKTRDSSITFNKLLENDFVPITEAKANFKWSKVANHWVYELNDAQIKNTDLDMSFDAIYEAKGVKSDERLMVKADLDRANLNQITRYFPIEMSKNARDYIRGTLSTGEIKSGKIHIDGNPNHIPFTRKFPGKFELYLPIRDVTYLPSPKDKSSKQQWSAFSKVNGLIQFKGPAMDLSFEGGEFESVKLTDIKGKVDDVTSNQASLSIRGVAQGQAQDLLDYYLMSPSAGRLSAINDQLKITGQGKLNIALNIPLNASENTRIEGEISLPANTINYGTRVAIKEVSGNIFFSEEKIIAKNLKAQWLGGEVRIDAATQLPWQKESFMHISGSANLDEIGGGIKKDSSYDSLMKQIEGRLAYSGKLSVTQAGYNLNLDLKLDQIQSQLPAPFNKKTGQSMNGQLSMTGSHQDNSFEHSGNLKIAKLLETRFAIKDDQEARVGFGVNTQASIPLKGTSANLVFESIDLDAWQKWFEKNYPESPGKSTGKNPIDSVSARFQQAKFYDQELSNITLVATHDKDLWQANISSSMATGTIQWRAAQIGLPEGKLTGNLKRLVIKNDSASDTLAKELNNRIQKIPAVDITAEELIFNDKHFGKMELIANNDKNDWRIDKLTLKTRDAQANATGKWILPKAGKKGDLGTTELAFDLDIENAGQLLDNLGFARAVGNGSGKLVGKISWVGEPHKYSAKTLKGELALDLAKGTILQVEPGVGRLLGVLSFQSITKIATLDIGGVLKPVVAQGTPFDRITSKGTISNGIANISDLTMKGPQGTIRLSGVANLIDETQDMRITVLPNLNAGSASVAYSFINPIVGLSTLVGQYLFSDEVSKLFQLDYLVQGTWDAPQVIVLDKKGKPIDENQLKEIRNKSLLKQQEINKK